jgi:Flp pilus assembly protein TadD
LFNAQGRNEEALAVLNEAWNIDPANARIPYQQALLLAEMQRPRKALDAFEKAEHMQLESDRLYVNHCILLQQRNDMRAAETVIKQGIQRFPASTDLQAEAAGLMLRMGRNREAAIHYATLRALAPNDPRLDELRRYLAP